MTTIEAMRDHDLKLIGVNATSIGFQGYQSDCLKLADRVGMKASMYRGGCERTGEGLMFWQDADEDNFAYCEFDGGGFMLWIEGDHYHLSIPFSTWSKGANA